MLPKKPKNGRGARERSIFRASGRVTSVRYFGLNSPITVDRRFWNFVKNPSNGAFVRVAVSNFGANDRSFCNQPIYVSRLAKLRNTDDY